MSGLHAGNHNTKREFLLLGEPIKQVSATVEIASNGKLAALSEGLDVLSLYKQDTLPYGDEQWEFPVKLTQFFSGQESTMWFWKGALRRSLCEPRFSTCDFLLCFVFAAV